MRKKRGYKRENFQKKRDYKLFAISCEGGEREPEYFELLENLSSRITIDIIEEIVPDAEMSKTHQTKSAPRWVLDRAMKYIERENLLDEDELWFVIDVDKWDKKQLIEIANYCKEKKNWHIALSNPCFEVWLAFHKTTVIPKQFVEKSKNMKIFLNNLTKSGYNKENYILQIKQAVENAKNADSDENSFFPKKGETKVYLLIEALMEYVGENDFNKFIDNFSKNTSQKL